MSRKLHNDARPGAAGEAASPAHTPDRSAVRPRGACVLALAVGGGPDSRYNAIR